MVPEITSSARFHWPKVRPLLRAVGSPGRRIPSKWTRRSRAPAAERDGHGPPPGHGWPMDGPWMVENMSAPDSETTVYHGLFEGGTSPPNFVTR